MDSKNYPMGDTAPDWNEMSMFNAAQFDDVADSPFGTSAAFNDFTNLDAFGDSPMGLTMRTPSKSGPDAMTAAAVTANKNQHNSHMMNSNSAETSSQDSSSDTSSRRKRKNAASESPISDPAEGAAIRSGQIKQEMDSKPVISDMQTMRTFDNGFVKPTHSLSLEQTMRQAHNGMANFDFNSAASSPIGQGDYGNAMSLDAQVNVPTANVPQFQQESPIQTINPNMFTMDSRDHSPAGNGMMFGTSPNAVFPSPSSNSPDAFNNGANWNTNLQTPNWANDFGMTLTPSPVANGATPSAQPHGNLSRVGVSPLHIAPISTKSRVETQINVVMTLEKPPPGIEHLHLPLHTIAKSKLLAKEEFDASKVLELHTMLVCTSAMHNAQVKEKALRRAAAQNNEEIQRRAELARESGDEEKNDVKNVDEADKPANGGEVRICTNCIQRERKRAGRKKTKREEEQLHWERFETERIVVFNSNEFLPFKPCDPSQYPVREAGAGDAEPYAPPDGALHVTAAMRIACYCRHQSEKEGFQVIFTMKDRQGNVVAQQLSDSILITDDHKTHPQSYATTMAGDGYYPNSTYMSGLQMSHSMVDMTTHVQPFTSSRSAGNLQALAYPPPFNAHSHVHQLPGGSGYTSQTTSATMTPTSLSRPGSPSNAGQSGPNKKRKSATFHRRVPSGLTMTPRVDTNQPPSNNAPSAMSMGSQFSPTNSAFPGQMNQGFMNIPNHGNSAQIFGSGPPTPNDSGPFSFNQSQSDMSRMSNNQAYFSHPSSAVPSRASSPVLQQGRGNMAAYARQQPIQTPTNSLNARSAMFAVPSASGSTGNDLSQSPFPSIMRTTPLEGPVTGGTEVAILGEGFVSGAQIMFGDNPAPTTFISSKSLIAVAPPGRVGRVSLSLIAPQGMSPYPPDSNQHGFRYTQTTEDMMVMALKFISQQKFGHSENWQTLAQQSASNFLQSNIGRAGLGSGYPAGNRMALEPAILEEMMLNMFDMVDMSENPDQPWYDMPSDSEATMLSLASALGMHRVAAALLARGANADVRDNGGYTPLMHAALQGRPKIFQLLLARGADPTVRSLTGYSAIDLVPIDMYDEFVQKLCSTKRRRNSRPALRSRPSYDSNASSKASWDISSASFYESDIDSSDRPLHSSVASRRQSVHALGIEKVVHNGTLDPAVHCSQLWNNLLATRLLGYVHRLNLPDYRYFSSMLQGKTLSKSRPAALDMSFSGHQESGLVARNAKHRDNLLSTSTSDPSCLPPPAYHDLFPGRQLTSKSRDIEYPSFADEKASYTRDNVGSIQVNASCSINFTCESSALPITWFWISTLMISTSIFMHITMPYITDMLTRMMTMVQTESSALSSV